MAEEQTGEKPSSERLSELRNLPKNILYSLTQEEINTFPHDDVWPYSLRDKLSQHIVDEG